MWFKCFTVHRPLLVSAVVLLDLDLGKILKVQIKMLVFNNYTFPLVVLKLNNKIDIHNISFHYVNYGLAVCEECLTNKTATIGTQWCFQSQERNTEQLLFLLALVLTAAFHTPMVCNGGFLFQCENLRCEDPNYLQLSHQH